MASIQCSKPVQGTAVVLHKTTTETCHSNEHTEHSFTDKVKEVAHSATKIFEHENQQNSGQHCHLTQKPHGVAVATSHSHTSTAASHYSSTAHKKEEGHGGLLHNLGEKIKTLTTSKKKHRKRRPAGSHNDSSSSSSDESDNETWEKKVYKPT